MADDDDYNGCVNAPIIVKPAGGGGGIGGKWAFDPF